MQCSLHLAMTLGTVSNYYIIITSQMPFIFSLVNQYLVFSLLLAKKITLKPASATLFCLTLWERLGFLAQSSGALKPLFVDVIVTASEEVYTSQRLYHTMVVCGSFPFVTNRQTEFSPPAL